MWGIPDDTHVFMKGPTDGENAAGEQTEGLFTLIATVRPCATPLAYGLPTESR